MPFQCNNWLMLMRSYKRCILCIWIYEIPCNETNVRPILTIFPKFSQKYVVVSIQIVLWHAHSIEIMVYLIKFSNQWFEFYACILYANCMNSMKNFMTFCLLIKNNENQLFAKFQNIASQLRAIVSWHDAVYYILLSLPNLDVLHAVLYSVNMHCIACRGWNIYSNCSVE